jgi:hypothetical protein
VLGISPLLGGDQLAGGEDCPAALVVDGWLLLVEVLGEPSERLQRVGAMGMGVQTP